MNDQDTTKEQLVAELAEMRRHVAEMDVAETERKRAEEALRQSEERYRSFVQSFPGIAYRGRIDFTVIFFHGAVEEITGYSEHDFTSGRIRWDNVIHPDDFASLRNSFEKVRVVPNYSTEREYRVVRKDGRTRWVHDVIHNSCDSSGKPAFVQGVVYDVTDRKQAEEALRESEHALREARDELEQRVKDRTAHLKVINQRLEQEIEVRKAAEVSLRESEERYRTLVETSPQAVVMTDIGGRITFASPQALELHGSETVEELYGRDPLDFVAPQDHDKFRGNLQKTLETGVLRNIEYTLVRKDGAQFAGELSSALIQDSRGQPQAMMAIIQDITERKQAAEALCQSHDQLRAIYDGMQDGLLVADIETKRFYKANRSICQMLGYSEDEILSSLTVKDMHPEEDWPQIKENFTAQAEQRSPGVGNVPFLRKDGTIFYADVSVGHIVYNDRPCMVGFFRDITERKKAEEAARREYRVLRQMLKALDRERQLVAYEIHDGLAQQLTGATMQFDSFEKLQNGNPQQALDCYSAGLHLLRKSVAEARRLISGLRPPILDESGIVAAIAHLVHDVMSQDGLEIEFQSSVRFDRLEPLLENALYRIVQEGLANVCRHSKSEHAQIRLVQEDELVRVEVRDWGIGFDPQSVEEKSFGLAGIRERARVLGGQATINSTSSEGTQIVVELPIRVSEHGNQ